MKLKMKLLTYLMRGLLALSILDTLQQEREPRAISAAFFWRYLHFIEIPSVNRRNDDTIKLKIAWLSKVYKVTYSELLKDHVMFGIALSSSIGNLFFNS